MNSDTGKWIIIAGLSIVVIGILIYFFHDKLNWIGRLPGEIFAVPNLPEYAGNNVVNITLPDNTCLNTIPFTVAFTRLGDFTLGNDTTLCEPG